MKNIRIFYLKIFVFMVVKFSVYLNRHVFVMLTSISFHESFVYASPTINVKADFNSLGFFT